PAERQLSRGLDLGGADRTVLDDRPDERPAIPPEQRREIVEPLAGEEPDVATLEGRGDPRCAGGLEGGVRVGRAHHGSTEPVANRSRSCCQLEVNRSDSVARRTGSSWAASSASVARSSRRAAASKVRTRVGSRATASAV